MLDRVSAERATESVVGQQRKWNKPPSTAALLLKADIATSILHGSFVPQTVMAKASGAQSATLQTARQVLVSGKIGGMKMNLQSMSMFAAAAFVLSPAALAETRNFDLPAFDEIHVSTGIKAEIVVGGDQSVVVEAEDDDDLDELEISVINGKLRIKLERSFFESLRNWFSEGPRLTARVSVPALTELEASSGADVDTSGMSGQYLVVSASSGARLTID